MEINTPGKQMNQIITSFEEIESVLILYHKPVGVVVSKKDPHNQTIYDLLPSELHGFEYVGRLDKDSSGLLLLTNDKKMVHELSHPSKGFIKKYSVRIDTLLSEEEVALSLKGMELTEEETRIKEQEIRKVDFLKFESLEQVQCKGYVELTIELIEGHKRHIRRLLRALGKTVFELHRTDFGPYSLGDLKVGKWTKG